MPADPALEALAAPYRPATPNETLEAVQGLMGLVYHEFQYEQHVTTVATTVPEVLKGRTGVCQDFAHVLIGLCRAIRLPARYVSGYIVPEAGIAPGPADPDAGDDVPDPDPDADAGSGADRWSDRGR